MKAITIFLCAVLLGASADGQTKSVNKSKDIKSNTQRNTDDTSSIIDNNNRDRTMYSNDMNHRNDSTTIDKKGKMKSKASDKKK